MRWRKNPNTELSDNPPGALLWFRHGWLALLALWFVVAVIIRAIWSNTGWWSLLISALLFAVPAAWLRMYGSAFKENYIDPSGPNAWKLGVVPDNMKDEAEGGGRYEPPPIEHFRRVAIDLGAIEGPNETILEDQVPVCTREHRFFLYARIGITEILGVVCFALFIGSTSGAIDVPWLWAVALVGMLISIPASWVASLPWKYKTVTVTEWYIRKDTKPPDWIPLWNPDNDNWGYQLIERIDPKRSLVGTFVGKLLGPGQTWGSIVLTLAGGDKITLHHMPDHLNLARRMRDMQVAYSVFINGGSDEAALLQALLDSQQRQEEEARNFFSSMKQFLENGTQGS